MISRAVSVINGRSYTSTPLATLSFHSLRSPTRVVKILSSKHKPSAESELKIVKKRKVFAMERAHSSILAVSLFALAQKLLLSDGNNA